MSNQINVPQLCDKHAALFLRQVGIGPQGPWRSALVAANIALFQGASTLPATYERLEGDITRVSELGCLACYRPDIFGEVVQAFQTDGIRGTKALGERLVAQAATAKGEGDQ